MQTSLRKNIVAISGSLRVGSSNHTVLRLMEKMMPANIDYSIYGGLSQLPHFDPGLDNDDAPESVAAFRNLITNADGIVICTPEYAYGVPGSLENALDWTVSSGSFVNKPLALITASTGGESADAAMLLILGALSANVLSDAALLISFIRSKIDKDGNVADTGTKERLKEVVNTLIRSI